MLQKLQLFLIKLFSLFTWITCDAEFFLGDLGVNVVFKIDLRLVTLLICLMLTFITLLLALIFSCAMHFSYAGDLFGIFLLIIFNVSLVFYTNYLMPSSQSLTRYNVIALSNLWHFLYSPSNKLILEVHSWYELRKHFCKFSTGNFIGVLPLISNLPKVLLLLTIPLFLSSLYFANVIINLQELRDLLVSIALLELSQPILLGAFILFLQKSRTCRYAGGRNSIEFYLCGFNKLHWFLVFAINIGAAVIVSYYYSLNAFPIFIAPVLVYYLLTYYTVNKSRSLIQLLTTRIPLLPEIPNQKDYPTEAALNIAIEILRNIRV